MDIHDADTIHPALEGVGLIANCVDQLAPHLLRAAITRGLAYTDVTAQPAFWRTALALSSEAVQGGARILLGSGLIPGNANVMVRAGAERVGGLESVYIALLLSMGDSFGPAALDYMLAAAAEPFVIMEDGRDRTVRHFSDGRPVNFPAPMGRCTVYRFALPDQVFYPTTLGARSAATRLALDPPWVTAVCAGLMRVGAGAWLRRAGFRRALIRLFSLLQKGYTGRDTFALAVEARGAQGTARLSLVGHEESAGTAIGAALMTQELYEGKASLPGV